MPSLLSSTSAESLNQTKRFSRVREKEKRPRRLARDSDENWISLLEFSTTNRDFLPRPSFKHSILIHSLNNVKSNLLILHS